MNLKNSYPVHPFPARMAPQLALKYLPTIEKRGKSATVLDPMMGSGTIPVLASLRGYKAVGFDVDPLAVLIARSWGTHLNKDELTEAASRIVEKAKKNKSAPVFIDDETKQFVNFWFDQTTQQKLYALASAIKNENRVLHDHLWCAFSRLIITKDKGASRARDVSHSRPHKVREEASFDPIDKYVDSISVLISRHESVGTYRLANTRLELADARSLPVRDKSIDVVLTSPPYLQAIDYMRGHKLSLVWMGYSVDELRKLRAAAVGTHRGLKDDTYTSIIAKSYQGKNNNSTAILRRYIYDMDRIIKEVGRVLNKDGRAIFVVAEATMQGFPVKISTIIKELCANTQLDMKKQYIREIPSMRRYLPPPGKGGHRLDKRMKEEICLVFQVA